MKLREYIWFNHGGRQRAFAKEHNLRENMVSRACNQKTIGLKAMMKIKRATGGQVTLDDLELTE